jgi:multiple sugar transport system permease protein
MPLLLLLVPSVLFLIAVFALPLLRYVWLSFHADSVMTGLVAIPNQAANWQRFIHDARYWQDLIQTMRFALVSVTAELVLGLIIALILNQPLRQRALIRSSSLIPWALPTTVMALGWRWIFNTPYGPIDRLMQSGLGRSLNALGEPSIAWITTVYADIWKTTPFVALILLAGLQTIPSDLYEAAKLEGAGPGVCLRRITIPLLLPYLGLALMFRLAQAFGVFDLVQVMTGGGPASSTESIALYAYWNALRFLDFGYSATIMIGSFLILSSLIAIAWFVISITRNRSAGALAK